MIIDGNEIKINRKYRGFDHYYYSSLTRFVQDELSKLPFVSYGNAKPSHSTDSIYFSITFKHVSDTRVLSLRTHNPQKRYSNYIYINVAQLTDLKALRYQIRKELTLAYNELAAKQQVPLQKVPTWKQFLAERHQVSRPKTRPEKTFKKRKLRGTRTEFRETQQTSFEQLMEEFSHGNGH